MKKSRENLIVATLIILLSLSGALAWQLVEVNKEFKSHVEWEETMGAYWKPKRLAFEYFIYQNYKNGNFKDTSMFNVENNTVTIYKDDVYPGLFKDEWIIELDNNYLGE